MKITTINNELKFTPENPDEFFHLGQIRVKLEKSTINVVNGEIESLSVSVSVLMSSLLKE